MLQRALAGPLDHRAVSNRITKWHTEFDHVRSGPARSQYDFPRGSDIRVTASDIGYKTGLMSKTNSAHRLRLSRKIPISLSPRPEIFTMTISDFFIFGARLMHSATACADSSAGMIPSVRASRVHASSASASEAATYSARFESASAACSGPIEG